MSHYVGWLPHTSELSCVKQIAVAEWLVRLTAM